MNKNGEWPLRRIIIERLMTFSLNTLAQVKRD